MDVEDCNASSYQVLTTTSVTSVDEERKIQVSAQPTR